jgi:hypothetical protein
VDLGRDASLCRVAAGEGGVAVLQFDPCAHEAWHAGRGAKHGGTSAATKIKQALSRYGRHGGGKQDRIKARAVATARLPQMQLPAQKGVAC